MGIDIECLPKFIYLKANPNGKYIKYFDEDNLRGQYSKPENIIYFINGVYVSCAIHEITHFYFHINDYDTKTLCKPFINHLGKNLSGYGSLNMIKENWEEVACEIVAAYGRRGQFNKIKDFFQTQPDETLGRDTPERVAVRPC
jgi:hypothetical protein